MSFNIPNVFIAGKKAIADEVNENFENIKDEINSHKSKITTLANSVDSFDKALNGGLKEELTLLIKNSKSLFCANIGNLDESGNADLIAIDSNVPNKIIFKVSDEAGDFSPVTYTNAFGETVENSYLEPIDMTGSEDGLYIIYGSLTGAPYAIKNTLTKSKIMPEMESGDVWLDLSRVPIVAKTYNGVSYSDFKDVPLGEVLVEEGNLTTVTTYPYNQNGFDINVQTKISSSDFADSLFRYNTPDYSKCIDKTPGETHTAECDGFVLLQTNLSANNDASLYIGDTWFYYRTTSAYSAGCFMYPVSKGDVYRTEKSVYVMFVPKRV